MLKNPISSLKEKVAQYIQLKFELVRLEVIERMVNVMGYFAFVVIATFLFFTLGIFLLLGIAECLSTLFNSASLGYFATAGIVLIACLIVAANSRKIIRFFAGKFVVLLTKNFKEENDDVTETHSDKNS